MSKIIEHFLLPLFVVVSVLYAFNSFGSDGIALNKVYHHTTQSPVHLERASISLYFSGDPQLQEVRNKKALDTPSSTFFFPKAVISKGECQAMVERLNNYNDGYTITMQEVVKPSKGILLTFNVDPHKLAISYELFDSIGLQKGIVFRLYNKELLKKLEQANTQPVLRTLWHTGKPSVVKSGVYPAVSTIALCEGGSSVERAGRGGLCIAIDPGHGGRDSGAIGCGGVQEKDICLAIGTVVGNLLEQHGCSVVLTRKSDCGVELDERTAYANNNQADLFVSIHANYAANSRVCGVETFCLQPQLFKQNFSQLSDDEDKYIAGVREQRADSSYALAQSIQRQVCVAIAEFHDEPIDRKVKHSVSQVMLGAQMPAVLIEVGFVSHKKESEFLNDADYQNRIAHSICNGILSARRI
jgi:N-acetylmuramoyl-L-alanine amidase